MCSANRPNQLANIKKVHIKKNVLHLFQETVCFVILNKTKNTFPTAFIQSKRWDCTVLAHLHIKREFIKKMKVWISSKLFVEPFPPQEKLDISTLHNIIGFKILSIGAEQNVCTSLDKNMVVHSVLLRSKIDQRVGGCLYLVYTCTAAYSWY